MLIGTFRLRVARWTASRRPPLFTRSLPALRSIAVMFDEHSLEAFRGRVEPRLRQCAPWRSRLAFPWILGLSKRMVFTFLTPGLSMYIFLYRSLCPLPSALCPLPSTLVHQPHQSSPPSKISQPNKPCPTTSPSKSPTPTATPSSPQTCTTGTAQCADRAPHAPAHRTQHLNPRAPGLRRPTVHTRRVR